nr:RNA-directed DNA polymerase [Tanacetum cinerariifolium]
MERKNYCYVTYRCRLTDDTPYALPPLRNILHQIDLSKKTTLLVFISNEVLGFNSIKELYTNDENYGNMWMELETKQHQSEFILINDYLFKGNRLCIPKTSLKSQLVDEIHAGGLSAHLGRDKTIASVESRFYWTQLKWDIRAFEKRFFCVKKERFPTQPATTEISGEDGSNLEEFSNVLTVVEADITIPIMAVDDEPLMMLGSVPNIIKEDFSNDLNGQHSANERRSNDTILELLKRNMVRTKYFERLMIMIMWWTCQTMSISKTFNVSDIYEFHSEVVNEGKHSRKSSFKERGNDDDMI